MVFPVYASVALLGLAMGAQLMGRSHLLLFLKIFFPLSVTLVLSIAGYFTYLQYESWSVNPLGKFYLPPHQGIDYFLFYTGTRIWGPWLIALAAAVLFGFLAHYFNRRFSERFFEQEEPWLFALGAFLTGYPGFLLYLVGVLFFGVLLSISYSLFSKGRAQLYWLWLPSALFVILMVQFVIPRGFLVQFNL